MLSSIGLACAPPLTAARRPKHVRSKKTSASCAATSTRRVPERQPLPARIAAGAAAIAAATLIAGIGSPMPAYADVPMVPAQDVTAAAKPLAKQEVQKGRVWLLLAGGSAVLFGSTVALERAKLFPAIAKANDAMSVNRAARQAAPDYIDVEADRQQQPNDVGSWEEADYPSTDAVLAGLQSASSRVLTGDKDDGGQTNSSGGGGISTADSKTDSPAAAEAGAGAAHSGAAAVAAGATAAAVEEPAAAQAHHSGEPEAGSAAAAAQMVTAEADDGSARGSDAVTATDAGASAEVAQSPAGRSAGGTSDQLPGHEASASTAEESSSSATTTAATDRSGGEASTTAVDARGRNGSSQDDSTIIDSTAPPILTELSSEEIERLIAAKLQQQQIAAESAKSQPALAGRNVEDLSEDELLSLIASKRRLAQIALSGVVDSDESSK